MNSGNCNAVILSANLRVTQDEGCDSFDGLAASLDYDIDPFILKASELAIKDGRFSKKGGL